MNAPRGISFDFGFSLARHVHAVEDIIAQELGKRGIFGSAAKIAATLPKASQLRRRAYASAAESPWAWRRNMIALYGHTVREFGLAAHIQETSDAIYNRYVDQSNWYTTQRHVELLRRLRGAGIRMALLSNWDERLPGIVASMGISSYFDAILASSTIRCAKPAAGAFNKVVESLAVPRAAILHVGDDPVADVRGARLAGLGGLLVSFDDCPDRVEHAVGF